MIRHDPPGPAGRRSLRRRDQRGAAAVEFALVFGIFFMVLYGLICFGMTLATKQRITNAAAEAARAAVGQSTESGAVDAATARVLAAGLPAGAFTPQYSTGSCGLNQCITVTITYDLKNHPVVPPAPGLGIVLPDSMTSTATVQYS